MPIYEYECKKCKYRFEIFQSAFEPPLTQCNLCGGQVYKVFHPVPIIFKGSGFHTTDYGKLGPKPASAGSKETQAEKEKGSSAESKEG